jgi:hypothetical protein
MTEPDRADPSQRAALGLLARIAIPPIVGFLVLAAYVGAEALGFRGLAAPEADTISEAAALGHAARALELIAAGQNPNDPFPIRPGILGANRLELRPVEAAILGRNPELMRLLQRAGATQPDHGRIVCLARTRLPEILPDLAAEPTGTGDTLVDITTALQMCSPAR